MAPGFCFARASQRRTRFESCTAAQARRCLRQKQPSWSRGRGLNFQAHCMRAGNSGHRNPNHQTRRIRTRSCMRTGSDTFFLCPKCCVEYIQTAKTQKSSKKRGSACPTAEPRFCYFTVYSFYLLRRAFLAFFHFPIFKPSLKSPLIFLDFKKCLDPGQKCPGQAFERTCGQAVFFFDILFLFAQKSSSACSKTRYASY